MQNLHIKYRFYLIFNFKHYYLFSFSNFIFHLQVSFTNSDLIFGGEICQKKIKLIRMKSYKELH